MISSRIATFPNAQLRCGAHINLISQLGHGGGSALISSALRLQQRHGTFVDALDEPSARIHSSTALGSTALFSFAVNQGHPWHCHAGKRVFVAVSGSNGAWLNFADAKADLSSPIEFARSIERVSMPPDVLFTVCFGPRVWHRFQGVDKHHPAFFALSIHPDDAEGATLTAEQRALVGKGEQTIAALTDVLPFDVPSDLLATTSAVSLSLEADTSQARATVCKTTRGSIGRVRAAIGSHRRTGGGWAMRSLPVREITPTTSEVQLLDRQFPGQRANHTDAFELLFRPRDESATPATLLANVLHGFVDNRPPVATALMQLRNTIVRPLRLRTSPLACPVSSLLGKETDKMFDAFPVFDSVVDAERAEVVLGADDKHVRFRTAVSISKAPNGLVRLSMSTKLITLNPFGAFYLFCIDLPHRKLVSPQIMRHAVADVCY